MIRGWLARRRSPAEWIQAGLGALLVPLSLALLGGALLMAGSQPRAFVQHLVNGLTLGGLFALIALGYTMVYGIIELINFAHGEVFMVGSFLGLIALQVLGAAGIDSVWVAPPLALLFAMLCCGALGVALDSIAYKPLRRKPTWSAVGIACLAIAGLLGLLGAGLHGELSPVRVLGTVALLGASYGAFRLDERNPSPPRPVPRINALLSAIGMSIFLQNLVMLGVGRDTQGFPQMDTFSGIERSSFPFLGIEVQHIEVMTLISSVGLMFLLDRFVGGTRVGRGMRAIAQDPEAAMMLGVPVNRVITMTFVVGSALAAAAGMLYGLRYGGIKFNDGFVVGMKAFTAAVLGGIGNIRGAMLGGFLLGLSETVVVATMEFTWDALGRQVHGSEARTLWPHAEFHDYKDAIAFLILVAVLTFRPSGLLGTGGVDKV